MVQMDTSATMLRELAAGSPCIDAGKNSYSASPTDLDGKARIANGTVDIGCREYSPAR